MTEQVPVWVTIMDAIGDELEAVTNTAGGLAFPVVTCGEPQGAPPDSGPYAHYWYLGRTDPTNGMRKTLGNVMYAARIQVMCFWPIRPERSSWGAWEADIATIDTTIRRRFRANSIINSNLTDLEIEDSNVTYGFLPIPGGGARALFRILEMEILLDNLEGEAIVA